jgi:hypothetical protein
MFYQIPLRFKKVEILKMQFLKSHLLKPQSQTDRYHTIIKVNCTIKLTFI